MTYNEAQKWLAKIGGEWQEAKEQGPGRGSIIVSVTSARRGYVQRHALFNDRLTGYERESAIREAFLRACHELRFALE